MDYEPLFYFIVLFLLLVMWLILRWKYMGFSIREIWGYIRNPNISVTKGNIFSLNRLKDSVMWVLGPLQYL